jgi:DNA-binding MarR family transcriptional regulator
MARLLVSVVRMIRGLPTTGAKDSTIKELLGALAQDYLAAEDAIKAVKMELRLTRNSAVCLGDITAPTAHEATLKMVQALNRELAAREQVVFEIIGRKNVQTWPDPDTVISEIELETTKAKVFREDAERAKLVSQRNNPSQNESTEQLTEPQQARLTVDSEPNHLLALSETEYAILQQLAKDRPQRVKIIDLAADLEARRTTVSEAVRHLESLNLVIRPKGKRNGITITEAGLAALRPCDRPPTQTPSDR